MNVSLNFTEMEQFKMYADLKFGELKASWNTAQKGKTWIYQCIVDDKVVYETKTNRIYEAIAVINYDDGSPWKCLNRFGRLDLVHSRLKDYRQTYMHKITLFVIAKKYQLTNQI